MRHPTAIICLTLAVLLGSAGMSWGGDSEDLAKQFALDQKWIVGVNNAGQKNEFVVSIASGNTLLEAFCNVVSDMVGVLSTQTSNKWTVTDRSELTFRSKFKVKTEQKIERRENIDGLVSEMSQSSFSIKSPKGRLFCQNLYQSKKSQLHLEVKSQLVLEFMGNDLDFSDVFNSSNNSTRGFNFMSDSFDISSLFKDMANQNQDLLLNRS